MSFEMLDYFCDIYHRNSHYVKFVVTHIVLRLWWDGLGCDGVEWVYGPELQTYDMEGW